MFTIISFAQQTGNDNPSTESSVQNALYGFIENKGQIVDQNKNPNTEVRYLLTLDGGMNAQLKANSFSYDTYTIKQ
jgi:hypothetical protein